MRRPGVVALVVAAVVAGCGGSSSGGTSPSVSATTVTTASGAVLGGSSVPTTRVRVDGDELVVAVAATPETRARGLMGVTDLGDLDGMLFVFDVDVDAAFWMKDTVLPLDIAFFDAAGRLVDAFPMEPCPADPCPTYRPAAPYRYALETPRGRLEVAVGSRLAFED